jgi:hypothetical protein
MLTCRETTELMTDEREGAIPDAKRFGYRFHMLICPYCRACRRQLDAVVALAQGTRRESCPAELESSVSAALRARAAKR